MTTAIRASTGSRGPDRPWHLASVPGLLGATFLFISSITPSLVPRSWYMQALTSGICMAYGYAVGVGVGLLWRKVSGLLQLSITVSPTAGRWLRIGGYAALVTVAGGIWLMSLAWQRQTAQLVGLGPPGPLSLLLGLIVSLVVFVGLVLLFRGLRALVRRGSRAGRRVMSPIFATPIALLLVASLVWFLTHSVLYRGFMEYTAAKAAGINATVPAGRTVPTSPLRSAGPGSPETWDSLGRNGQAFVADGSTRAAIAAATGKPAVEPIRVYAGLSRGRSLDQVADAVVAELQRTGGFDRDVLAVMTTTGRGWVDEWSASSIEYLSGGDSAIAAMQYSYLPSIVALLADRETPATAGRLLFTKVYAEWSRRQAGDRPKLVVGGESLGAYGGQSAFTDVDDMLDKIDGAVWVGTPNFTPLWRGLTDHRQGGSPEIAPVVDSGAHIRFATQTADLTQDIYGRTYGTWEAPRVVYAQHASDPITWWSPDLLTDEPPWLRERVGKDVNDMRWATFATFWQLTTDMTVANATPPGHGHRYTEELVPAWAAVLGQIPSADYTSIQDAIRKDYRPI
jgi:uncharacterized membrane protein